MADQEQLETPVEAAPEGDGIFSQVVQEIIGSPVNSLLLALIVVLLYKIFKPRDRTPVVEDAPQELPPLRKDLTPAELRAYDGTGPDGRVCVAVNGIVFDVTRGRHFYGPGGPYSAFAGQDASRGLATFSIQPSQVEYDDLSDLDAKSMESVREWEEQFKEKYLVVGKLLKPGETPTNYSEEETEPETSSTSDKKNE